MIKHIHLNLPEYKRGFHLITHHVLDAIENMPSTGMCHIFIKHTSASLTINENADPSVREDLEAFTNKLVPENADYFTHTFEGSDDMPAHIKASLYGNNISIPIVQGSLALGTWQGIYLGEHRNYGGNRTLIITVIS